MLLSKNEREEIASHIHRLLDEVGIRVESEELRSKMVKAGCRVKTGNWISIPAQLLRNIAEKQRNTQEEDGDVQELIHHCNVDWTHAISWKHHVAEMKNHLKRTFLMPAFDCGPTRYYDFTSGALEHVTTEIFITMKKLAQSTPEIGYVSNWYRSDVPQKLERLESLILAFQYTDKSAGVEAIFPETVKYLKYLSDILSGDSGDDPGTYVAGSQCITPPLHLEERSARDLLERYKSGMKKYHVASMGVIGMSMPITLAGALVVSCAEILGGWAAVYAVDPDAYMNGRMISNSINMRTLEIGGSGPETILLNMGVKDVFDTFYGGHLWVEPYFSPSSPLPGIKAVYENFYASMARSHLEGGLHIPYCGVGTLGNGGIGSPTQLMLDMEIRKSQFHMDEQIHVNNETLPYEEIVSVLRDNGQFLESESTLRSFRNLWESSVFSGAPGKDAANLSSADRGIMDRCDQIWRDNIKNNYEYAGLEPEKIKELSKVLDRAKEELLD
jgi:trimethylamine:corrinoid methyltransferase-like protein